MSIPIPASIPGARHRIGGLNSGQFRAVYSGVSEEDAAEYFSIANGKQLNSESFGEGRLDYGSWLPVIIGDQ